MGFKKLWSKVARSLAIHRIVRLDYPFASQAASVKDGYATCEVLDRCCLRCFLGGILHGVNWPLLLVCLQHSALLACQQYLFLFNWFIIAEYTFVDKRDRVFE